MFMRIHPSFLPLVSVLVPLLLPGGGLAATDGDAGPGTISVVGVGEATREPDLAITHLTVLTRHPSLANALSQNGERTERLLALLRGHGVAGSDLRTSRFHAGERRERHGEAVQYEVQHTVRVTLRNLDEAGAILADAMQHASRLRSMSLGSSEPESLAREARLRALDNARERARQYAERAGVSLGPVLSISEEVSTPRPRRPSGWPGSLTAETRAGGPDSPPLPIARGELTARVRVRVIFSMRPS